MTDALDVRWSFGQAHQLARPRQRRFPGVELVARLGTLRRERRNAVHALDLIAIRLGEPHPLAAAGLVDRLDAAGAGCLGEAGKIVFARRVIGETQNFGSPFSVMRIW